MKRMAIAAALALCAVSSAASADEMTAKAEKACIAAVEKETGTTGATLISSDYSEAGTKVLVQVVGAEKPWSCLSSNAGEVEEVMYMGEG